MLTPTHYAQICLLYIGMTYMTNKYWESKTNCSEHDIYKVYLMSIYTCLLIVFI